jgi:VanZ family protein
MHWIGAGVVVIPWLVAAFATVIVARRRGVSPFATTVALLGITWGFAIVAASLFPFPLPPYTFDPSAGSPFENLPNLWLNPFPLHTLARATRGSGSGVPLAVANVLAYLPLGLILSVLDPRASVGRAAAIGLVCSGGVELLQLSLSLVVGFPYRAADIDDVLLNVLGVMAGYAIVRLAIPTARTAARRGQRARTTP